MSSFNKVMLLGNLTRDPEVRYIPSGTAVCDIGLAINDSYKTKDGDKKESTVFVDIVVWGNSAENCGKYLSQGSQVFIEGRLQLDQWESKDGDKRSKLRVRADNVQFMSAPKGERQEENHDGVPTHRHEADIPEDEGNDQNLPF